MLTLLTDARYELPMKMHHESAFGGASISLVAQDVQDSVGSLTSNADSACSWLRMVSRLGWSAIKLGGGRGEPDDVRIAGTSVDPIHYLFFFQPAPPPPPPSKSKLWIMAPNSQATTSFAEARAEALKAQGNEKYKVRRYDEAIKLYKAAIEMQPNVPVSSSEDLECIVQEL